MMCLELMYKTNKKYVSVYFLIQFIWLCFGYSHLKNEDFDSLPFSADASEPLGFVEMDNFMVELLNPSKTQKYILKVKL